MRIGYVEFPPFTYTSDSGEATGTLTETTRHVLEDAGIPYQFIRLPAKRLARDLISGRIQVFQGIKNHPALQGHTQASKHSLATIRLCAYSLPGQPPGHDKEMLKHKRVLTLLGYGYGSLSPFLEDPQNDIDLLSVSSRESAIEMLRKGRADYFLDYHSPASEAMKALGEKQLQADELISYPTFWVVSKAFAGSDRLLQAMDSTFVDQENGAARVVEAGGE
ncbi:transporter substrate-binding domain-containing protein [Marinobacteraceae bacterium S3BR75-40.1]